MVCILDSLLLASATWNHDLQWFWAWKKITLWLINDVCQGHSRSNGSTLHIWQSLSVAVVRLTLCNPMDCSMPGFPVLNYLSEFAQIHVHRVSDAIQPSHPLLPLSSLVLNLSQHQATHFSMSWLFASGGQSLSSSALVKLPCTCTLAEIMLNCRVWSNRSRGGVWDSALLPGDVFASGLWVSLWDP